MSIVIAIAGKIEQPKSMLLPDTSINTVYELAAGSSTVATVVGITIVNRDNAAQKVTVWWSDGTTDFALFERSVPANDTVTVALDAPILLYAKQFVRRIKAQAAKANVVTVTVTYTLANQNTNVG